MKPYQGGRFETRVEVDTDKIKQLNIRNTGYNRFNPQAGIVDFAVAIVQVENRVNDFVGFGVGNGPRLAHEEVSLKLLVNGLF